MTWMDDCNMGTASPLTRPGTNALGDALGAMLKARYPHHTIKQVARALSCTPKAAENLLDGHLSARSLGWLIEAFGAGFVAEAVLIAGGHTLASYVRAQAEQARAEALRFQDHASELDEIEKDLRAHRRAVAQGGVG